jgi:hypothetical protein
LMRKFENRQICYILQEDYCAKARLLEGSILRDKA